MAFAIYKPGQGYWTRVMTAVFAGVLVMAAAVWLYGQALLIPLPDRAWSMSYSVAANFDASQPVDLLGPEGLTARPELGTATIETVDASSTGGTITLVDYQLTGEATRSQISALRASDGQIVAITGGGVRGVPVVDRIYVQGAMVLVTVLIGAIGIVYFVAMKKGSVDFLIATDGEMRKVNWSTRKDVINSTWVVIGASAILGLYLFGFDTVFALFFRAIGVLDI